MVLSSELLGCGAVTLRKQTVMNGVIVGTAGLWSCYFKETVMNGVIVRTARMWSFYLKETNSHEWCYLQNCWVLDQLPKCVCA